MKRILAVLSLLGVLITGAASPAQAQSSWSAPSKAGVAASGTYTTSGSVTAMSGYLYDTGSDGMWVRLYVRFSSECCAHIVDNKNGTGTKVSFTLTTYSPHADVKVCTKSSWTVFNCSSWKRIF